MADHCFFFLFFFTIINTEESFKNVPTFKHKWGMLGSPIWSSDSKEMINMFLLIIFQHDGVSESKPTANPFSEEECYLHHEMKSDHTNRWIMLCSAKWKHNL